MINALCDCKGMRWRQTEEDKTVTRLTLVPWYCACVTFAQVFACAELSRVVFNLC